MDKFKLKNILLIYDQYFSDEIRHVQGGMAIDWPVLFKSIKIIRDKDWETGGWGRLNRHDN